MVRFSRYLNKGNKVTIERYTGSYTDGVFTRTLDSTFDINASFQPYSTTEDSDKFMPTRGTNVEQKAYLYCKEELYTTDATNSHPVEDMIIVNGVKWKAVRVEPWTYPTFRSVSHYRYVLELFDGY